MPTDVFPMAMNARLWQAKRRLPRPCLWSAWAERFPLPIWEPSWRSAAGSPHTPRHRHGPAPAQRRAGPAGPAVPPPRRACPGPHGASSGPASGAAPPGGPSGPAASPRPRRAQRRRRAELREPARARGGCRALAAAAGGGRPFLLRLPAGGEGKARSR